MFFYYPYEIQIQCFEWHLIFSSATAFNLNKVKMSSDKRLTFFNKTNTWGFFYNHKKCRKKDKNLNPLTSTSFYFICLVGVLRCINSISVIKLRQFTNPCFLGYFLPVFHQSIILTLAGLSWCKFHNPKRRGGKPLLRLLKTLVAVGNRTHDLPLAKRIL